METELGRRANVNPATAGRAPVQRLPERVKTHRLIILNSAASLGALGLAAVPNPALRVAFPAYSGTGTNFALDASRLPAR
jgi:hypothetical protein